MSSNNNQRGDRVTFAASALTGPNNPIKGGDPVYLGRLAGVAYADAVPGSAGPFNDSNVVVQLSGVFTLSVTSEHIAMAAGDTVYIGTDGILSDDLTDTPYGINLD